MSDSGKRFDRSFFRRDSPTLAKEVLGAYLHRVLDGEELIGRIVEVEAYAVGDPASHAFRGMTPRNKVMFGAPGLAYIYLTYGMHHCFNVVTNEQGEGEALLVRALEPIAGIETMRRLRGGLAKDRDLASGPGKLCQALALSRNENGIDLIESEELFLTRGTPILEQEIGVSTRIGISLAIEHPWRFYVEGNTHVSKGRPSGTPPRSRII